LGIGGGVSSALIEGVARAGCGFAQMVTDNEQMDSKVVRMVSMKGESGILNFMANIFTAEGSTYSTHQGLSSGDQI
jgi:hypothetical protein